MNFNLLILLVFSFIFSPADLFAKPRGTKSSLEVGGGLNAYTGGRTIPSLEISYSLPEEAYSWAATGVRNKYYYQSSHLLFYFRKWIAGTMWGGEITSGFGGGAGYSVRSFKDYESSSSSTKSDYLLGPAIKVSWSYGPVYLNLSTIFGLRDLSKHILGLNFQNVESLTIGYRF